MLRRGTQSVPITWMGNRIFITDDVKKCKTISVTGLGGL
jgi:hypothetical protein